MRIAAHEDTAAALRKLDGFLCEIKDCRSATAYTCSAKARTAERLDALLVRLPRAARHNPRTSRYCVLSPPTSNLARTHWRSTSPNRWTGQDGNSLLSAVGARRLG